MDIILAKKFIESSGSSVEIARLNYIMTNKMPSRDTYISLIETQKEDGGWPLAEAPNISSIDATCYHLSQIEQLGIKNDEMINKALKLLLSRQKCDGSFEEDISLESYSPPWAKPGVLKAKIYLTANCAYWIEYFNSGSPSSRYACDYLRNYINKDGILPSFLHANWLAAALLYKLDYKDEAQKIIEYLCGMINEMSASSIVWLLNAFSTMDVQVKKELIVKSIERLTKLQQSDGCWNSDDGRNFDVHVTLEAIRGYLAYHVKKAY